MSGEESVYLAALREPGLAGAGGTPAGWPDVLAGRLVPGVRDPAAVQWPCLVLASAPSATREE